MSTNFRVDGKVALITGAGRGIGLAIAKALAAGGASVAIQDIDLAVAQKEVDGINASGGKAIALGGDIGDPATPERLIRETVASLGGLHILINNAAIQILHHWLEAPPEETERQLRADLIAPIHLCQLAVPIFKAQRFGRIINIGSIQQKRGNAWMLGYSLSKAALEKFTAAIARDLAKDQITVNLLAPGWVNNTHRNRETLASEEAVKEKGKNVPLGRLGEPEDHVGMALLLCSEAGSYITGQSIHVDGGMSA